MKHVIHVNQHVIKANRKHGATANPITVKNYKETRYGSDVEILGADGSVVARVVYRPDNPLSCGAHVWIETQGDVRIDP